MGRTSLGRRPSTSASCSSRTFSYVVSLPYPWQRSLAYLLGLALDHPAGVDDGFARVWNSTVSKHFIDYSLCSGCADCADARRVPLSCAIFLFQRVGSFLCVRQHACVKCPDRSRAYSIRARPETGEEIREIAPHARFGGGAMSASVLVNHPDRPPAESWRSRLSFFPQPRLWQPPAIRLPAKAFATVGVVHA